MPFSVLYRDCALRLTTRTGENLWPNGNFKDSTEQELCRLLGRETQLQVERVPLVLVQLAEQE